MGGLQVNTFQSLYPSILEMKVPVLKLVSVNIDGTLAKTS
jgi:hypothetical protein